MLHQAAVAPLGASLGGVVRSTLFVSVLVGLLSAAPADAVVNGSECRRLTRQIDHYADVAEMAADRGDQVWLNGTLTHMERLAVRRIKLCPQFDRPNQAEVMAKWMAAMVKRAGKAFLKYLTFGAY